jgi:hypothetical protein
MALFENMKQPKTCEVQQSCSLALLVQKYLLYWYKSTCFTGTKISCFTGTKVLAYWYNSTNTDT